jgi:hypothetical protein
MYEPAVKEGKKMFTDPHENEIPDFVIPSNFLSEVQMISASSENICFVRIG